MSKGEHRISHGYLGVCAYTSEVHGCVTSQTGGIDLSPGMLYRVDSETPVQECIIQGSHGSIGNEPH